MSVSILANRGSRHSFTSMNQLFRSSVGKIHVGVERSLECSRSYSLQVSGLSTLSIEEGTESGTGKPPACRFSAKHFVLKEAVRGTSVEGQGGEMEDRYRFAGLWWPRARLAGTGHTVLSVLTRDSPLSSSWPNSTLESLALCSSSLPRG